MKLRIGSIFHGFITVLIINKDKLYDGNIAGVFNEVFFYRSTSCQFVERSDDYCVLLRQLILMNEKQFSSPICNAQFLVD